ncbi:MAG: FlgD immunoglobulin-like domain containing protein [Bacteroidota bacterium]
MKPNLTLSIILLSGFFSAVIADGQVLRESSYKLERTTSTSSSVTPLSNSVTDILISGTTIWFGTGKGLSRSTDGGVTWKNYYNTQEFGLEAVSAIAIHNSEVWVATAHDTTVDGSSLQVGSGLRYSSDWGETWSIIPQPRDYQNIDTLIYGTNRLLALGVTTNVNNITFDIAATDSAVWIVSYAGMARKSTDKGKTWQVVIIPPDNLDKISPTDSLSFDVSPVSGSFGLTGNLNHRAFSAYAENWSTIWIGTAGGINRTTDGGQSWVKYDHTNEASPISGNFVVALHQQNFAGHAIMWAATINADGPTEQRGVSFSADSGQTWKTTLIGEFCHNIGFKDSIIYAVTDDGIYRSADIGTTWSQPGTIYDNSTNQQIAFQSQFYAVDVLGENVWFGGGDGAAYTEDDTVHLFGSSWHILHAAQPLSSNQSTYAYPNPFSPTNEIVRLHYSVDKSTASVTIRIFDFGMNLVRTVISDANRNGIAEHDEVWDGKNDKGRQVSNGPYFYQVVIGNEKPIWGKILVLQ